MQRGFGARVLGNDPTVTAGPKLLEGPCGSLLGRKQADVEAAVRSTTKTQHRTEVALGGPGRSKLGRVAAAAEQRVILAKV